MPVNFSRDDLEILATAAEPPCVSIFLPTHRSAGREVRQDPIRLKNLIADAEAELTRLGWKRAAVDRCLEEVHGLLDDDEVWGHREDGLAVLAAPQVVRWYRVPLVLQERVVVGERFHLKPLLPLLYGNDLFYVLAISQKSVRLFAATHDAVSAVELENVPKNVVDAVGRDWEEDSIQLHTGAGTGAGPRSMVFHGQGKGGDDDTRKREITRFLEMVDAGVCRALAGRQAPLVLAAVDYVAGIYRQVTRYRNLLPTAIEGSPELLSGEQLRDRAREIVDPLFTAPRNRARDRFNDLRGTDRVTSELATALRAALDGRVESVFVALGEERWGRIDVDSRRTEIHDQRQPGDEDLLDRLAIETLKTAGAVYAVPRSEIPGESVAAAVMRY